MDSVLQTGLLLVILKEKMESKVLQEKVELMVRMVVTVLKENPELMALV
jgi:hypothetical protein